MDKKGNARDPLRQRRLITPAFSRRQDSPIADLIGKCLMEVSALSEPLTTDTKCISQNICLDMYFSKNVFLKMYF